MYMPFLLLLNIISTRRTIYMWFYRYSLYQFVLLAIPKILFNHSESTYFLLNSRLFAEDHHHTFSSGSTNAQVSRTSLITKVTKLIFSYKEITNVCCMLPGKYNHAANQTRDTQINERAWTLNILLVCEIIRPARVGVP